VLIPAKETSANDGVAQARSRFAPWDAPEGPGSSVEGQADHRLPPAPAATYRAASRLRPVRTGRVGAASLKTGTDPGDAPSCAVAVVTYVRPIQH
jgi:hypothetical protein